MKRSILFPSRFQTIPQITTTSLPSGNINVSYSFQFTEAGGTYPFTWSAAITPNTGGQFTLNPVTGVISGTPGTAETETVTVTVTDSMTPHNTASAVFSFAVNTSVIITTNSLPPGSVGVPYSVTLNATGGTPPYTWGMSPSSIDGLTLNAATGTLSGTPTSATTATGTFTATDSVNLPSAPVSLQLSVGVGGGAPTAMWPGYSDSVSLEFGWWGPANQTAWNTLTTDVPPRTIPNTNGAPDHYRVYRDGSLIYGTLVPWAYATIPGSGVEPNPNVTGVPNSHASNWFVDTGLTANTAHTYTVTSVDVNGNESSFGPPLTMTTLANGSSVLPTNPANPNTWITSYALPTGHIWLCTNLTAVDVAGSTAGNTTTGCSFRHALANANPNGGDLIVLTAGATYAVPTGSYTPQAFTGANGWTYIVSSQDPGYQAGGTLIPYSASGRSAGFTVYTCTAGIGAGATTATLSAPWASKTGLYYVNFSDQEERLVTFTNGSASISWASNNGIYTSAGLAGAVTATIQVAYLEGVTPSDIPSMATLQVATGTPWGVTIPAACTKLRFVGINFTVGPSVPACSGYFLFTNSHPGNLQVSAESIYFDRCIFGADTGSPTYSFVPVALQLVNCNHLLVHQTYFWGLAGGQESHCLGMIGGGPTSIQYSYLEAVSECVLDGGAYIEQTQISHDYTFRYNMTHKPAGWILPMVTAANGGLTPASPVYNSFGKSVKNHFELKTVTRCEAYGNLMLNNWVALVVGYHGAAFAASPRDQTLSAPAATNYDQTCPWNQDQDIDFHDNLIYNVGCGLFSFGQEAISTTTRRLRFANNQIFLNPLFPGAERARAIILTGPIVDLTVDHNTIVYNTTLNTQNPNTTGVAGPAFAFDFQAFGAGSGSYGNPQPYSPNPWTRWQDRMTITNNILDASVAFNSAIGGFAQYQNLTYHDNLVTNNAPTTTTPAYQPGTFSGVAYASIGFANFQGNTAIPLRPSDWNVINGTYATASTTGGPLGAVFSGPLANDPFPRTIWQVIQPNNAIMAGATFATNAAKYNVICCGPYLGTASTTNIETDMGTTFPTIFASIKAQSTANGFATPTRCLHYIDATAQNTTGGASGPADPTFVQWTNAVNATNWWIRTSYPAGSIVPATNFGDAAGSGLTAVTSQNAITDGSGLTFSQQFARQYDLALRTGQGTTLGYGAGKALVANSLLDGYQFDNHVSSIRSTGAWGMNTTSYVSNWSSSGNPTADAFVQDGEAAQVAAMRAQFPGVIIWGNSDYFVHANGNFSYSVALQPSQQGLYDIVFLQSCIGAPGGIEGQGTTTTAQFMANYIAAFAQAAPGGTVMFEQTGRSHAVGWTTVAQSGWTATDWQAARFGLSCCVMQNGHYALNSQQNYNPNAPYFMDETLQQGSKYGWLGLPIDAPQSAARTSGVWWRRFQNGVVFMNPKGNGVQALTLATLGLSPNLKAIASNGFGDASINTGAPVTSITLQDRDGRFLVGAP